MNTTFLNTLRNLSLIILGALLVTLASFVFPNGRAQQQEMRSGQTFVCGSEVEAMSSSQVLTPEQVRSAVASYFEGTRSMNAAQWASAFAANAVVEDPMGQPSLTTPEAILAQGEGFVNAFSSVGLNEVFVAVSGNEAVAYWVGQGVQPDGQRVRFEGINHFCFGSDGKIVNLRGFWNPENVRPE
jgi:steroid delta-isomerase